MQLDLRNCPPRKLAQQVFQSMTVSLGLPVWPTGETQWVRALAGSLGARRLLAALFDEVEGAENVSVTHLKRTFIDTFGAVESIWLNNQSPLDDAARRELADQVVNAYERTGFLLRKPFNATAPLFRAASNDSVLLLRGIGPDLDVKMSGYCPWLPRVTEQSTPCPVQSAASFMRLPQESSEDLWHRLVASARWRKLPDQRTGFSFFAPLENRWHDEPRLKPEELGLARFQQDGTHLLFLLRKTDKQIEIAPITDIDAVRSQALALQAHIHAGGTPTATIRNNLSTSGPDTPSGYCFIELSIMPPTELNAFFQLASWPLDYQNPSRWRRAFAAPVAAFFFPLLELEGFCIRHEHG